MENNLVILESNPQEFFKILPPDWQEAIVPLWNDYKSSAKIYVFKENRFIIAGGIVFSTCPPDMTSHSKEAQKWFDKGYLYIGFLFVNELYRHQRLGSLWIQCLKELMPNQNFWLVIEDENLGYFYERQGFTKEKSIVTDYNTEWLYTYQSTKP